MRHLSRWRAERRQRRHHRPFRIAAPVWSGDDRALLVASLRDLAGKAEPDSGRPGPAADGDLVEAAISLWRAQRRLARLDGDCSPEASAGTRQVRRYLVAVGDALRAAGVKVQDHEGTRYDPGMALEVKAWVYRPDLDAETVVETVRPSVYVNGRFVQMGQVIVGCPTDPSTDSQPPGGPGE